MKSQQHNGNAGVQALGLLFELDRVDICQRAKHDNQVKPVFLHSLERARSGVHTSDHGRAREP